MLATTLVPWTCETSMHSIRSGASGSSSASCSSDSARRAGGQVAGALDPVPGERLLGVALDGLHQAALVAALRHPQRHLAAAQLLEQLGVDVGVLGQLGDEHLARHRLPRLADAGLLVDAAVDLQQELLDELAGGDLLDLVDDPAALAAHPAAADVEDLDGGLQLVLGEGDDVGVRAVTEDDGLLLQRPAERAEVVAEPGGLLELQVLRRPRPSRARAA